MRVHLLEENPDRIVILDGRPFSKQSQVAEVQELARSTGHDLRVIYCWAPDDVVYGRLEEDAKRMQIADRTIEKYRRIQCNFEPLIVGHLVLDTSSPVDYLVQKVLTYIGM